MATQVLSNARSGSIASASTIAAQGPDVPGRLFYFKVRSGITGTVTILGVDGTTPDSTGPVFISTDVIPVFAVDNLNKLAFKFSVNAGTEILDYIVLK